MTAVLDIPAPLFGAVVVVLGLFLCVAGYRRA